MYRSETRDAIILRTNRIGEINKGLTLFTDRGLLDCIAYGALKERSKLRSATQLFCYATFYLYHNPVKNSYKVTDIAIKSLCDGLAASMEKYYTANLWAEIVIKSSGGEEHAARILRLITYSFALLDRCAESDTVYLLVQFVWRYLRISGLMPETGACNGCGAPAPPPGLLYYDKRQTYFLCTHCAGDRSVPVHPGTRIYLAKSLALNLDKALTLKIERTAIESLKRITFQILKACLEQELNTLKSWEGCDKY